MHGDGTMPRNRWLHVTLLGALGSTSALGACFLDSVGDCEQNGFCVDGHQPASKDSSTSSGGDPDAGNADAGGVLSYPVCECDDGNPCTEDICELLACSHTALADGTPLDGTTCGWTCSEGEAVAASAETLCEGGGVCDGAGNCVSCDAVNTCPTGFVCSNGGVCLLDLGGDCSTDESCESGHCVLGKCCSTSCGICRSCDDDFSGCKSLLAYQDHPACYPNQACDGHGHCKLLDGELCGGGGDALCISGSCTCASGNCEDDGSFQICASERN